jgi:type II secretory pathway predicted ATPase ExeA
MMYLDHYGLREAPFRLTPLTDFFFPGARRGATVDALIYAILHDEGIVMVGGEVGAGKTMLCRVLIERLPEQVDTVYVANPTLAPEALLRTVAKELGLSLPAVDMVALLGAIQDELIRRHGAGRRVVALIDEAHAMPAESLEQIRLLSNLETGRHKLLQLVLFGQPELDALLETRPMRPLRDRITHHFRLDPLSAAEVTEYLDFRLRAAGYRGPALFSPAASRRIAHYAGGLTRRVNVLADKALLAAYAQNMHAINPSHVKSAARDARYLPTATRRPGWLAVPVLLVAAILFAWQAFDRQAAPEPAPPADPPSTAKPPARSSEPATVPAATPDAPAGEHPLTAAALAAQARWMREADDNDWFIQLHTNTDSDPTQLEAQIERARAALPAFEVRAYAVELGSAARTGVVIGRYGTEQEALAALAALPEDYRRLGAYIRQARRLR